MRSRAALLGLLLVGCGDAGPATTGAATAGPTGGASGAPGGGAAGVGMGGGGGGKRLDPAAGAGGSGAIGGGAGSAIAMGGASAAGAAGVAGASGSSASTGGGAGAPPLSPACGAPAVAGAALVSVGTDFCVDGWCTIHPKPTFASIVDAVLLDGGGWAATTGRQVVARTDAGIVQLGSPFEGRISHLIGTSLTDLYVTVDHTEDRLWHFDGVAWASLGKIPAGGPSQRAALGLAASPSGAVYVLDEGGDVTRFDGCGLSRWPAVAPWVDVVRFTVLADDRLVGVTRAGDIVKWADEGYQAQALPGDFEPAGARKITSFLARSIDEQLVGTNEELLHVVGDQVHVHAGATAAVAVDPASPAEVSVWGFFGTGQDALYRLKDDILEAEPVPPSAGWIESTEIRRLGDRRLVFSPRGSWHPFLERVGGSWLPLYEDAVEIVGGGAIAGPSGQSFTTSWQGSFVHSDGLTVTPDEPPPGVLYGVDFLFQAGPSLLALDRGEGRFASRTDGVWTELPKLPFGFTPVLRHAASSIDNVFATVRGQGITTMGNGGPPPGLARFDGVAWQRVPMPTGCSLEGLAAVMGGALAATGCGVQRFADGKWTTEAGTSGWVRAVAATPSGAWVAARDDGTGYAFANGVLTSIPGPDVGKTVRLVAAGEEVFAYPRASTFGGSIRRFVGNGWETVAPMPASLAGSSWEGLLVADDAFVLASYHGSIVRRPR